MTKVTYTITTPNGKVLKATSYAECLAIKNTYKGSICKVSYEPMTPPEEKVLPLLPKQLLAKKFVKL